MRRIGTLPEGQAQPFADHLLTLGIPTRVDRTRDGDPAIWVEREEQLERAREELEAYRADPDDPRYRAARREAEQIRREADRLEREHARKTVDLRTRISRSPPVGPLTRGVLVACIGLFLVDFIATGARPLSPIKHALYFTEWYPTEDGRLADRGFAPILEGQAWRLVTPILLHGGPIHLIFNMYMFSALGGMLERRRGTAELAVLILASAVVSNVAQYALPDLFTVPSARGGPNGPFLGLSGVLYALFGYAWMRGRYDPGSGLRLHPQTVGLLLIWLVVCAFDLFGFARIANTAHVAGLLTGMAFAFGSMYRDGVWR